jgi:hypothetical protein
LSPLRRMADMLASLHRLAISAPVKLSVLALRYSCKSLSFRYIWKISSRADLSGGGI